MDTAKTTDNKATLVTALYYHKYNEIIGGRGWSFDFYSPPFLNILKLDLPIVIYTPVSYTHLTLPTKRIV